MPILLNEETTEIEQLPLRFFVGDLTANWDPMVLDDTDFSLSDVEDADLTLKDIQAGLEVENIYNMYGKTAFKSYDEYKHQRLGRGV